MALILQDDTGTVADANAYIDVAFFKAYCALRSKDISAISDANIELLIIQATDFIDVRYTYNGSKLTGYAQETEFPRADLYSRNCELVEGIPKEVKSACCEYAFIANSESFYTNVSASEKNVISKTDKVDVLETSRTYSVGTSSSGTFNTYQYADQLLLKSGFTGSSDPTTHRA